MLVIGSHLTIAKGFTHAAKSALAMGGNTFQFFSRNPRGGNAKIYDEKDVNEFQAIRKRHHFGPIMAHAPYTLNLASAKEDVYEFSKRIIKEDIIRMNQLNIEYLNIHPGSHVGQGMELGIEKIITGINDALTGNEKIKILLETMPGKGSEIGDSFEQLKIIMDQIIYKDRIGICMDSCHVFSAGYDIVGNLDKVLNEFDTIIGLQHLNAIHLNDSMMPFGSKKDCHARIGDGEIGLEAIITFMKNENIKNLPFYLETPLEVEGHKEEIEMIKQQLGK